MAGVLFPTTEKGDRSTTPFNKAAYLALAEGLGDNEIAEAITAEKDWRHGYVKHLDRLTQKLISVGMQDRATACTCLRAGLERARAMEFACEGTCQPLAEAMAAAPASPLRTVRIQGKGEPREQFCIPYAGVDLEGAALDFQCDRWATAGTMEPDCADCIKEGIKKVASLRNRTFIALGANSELSPVRPLLEAGATVIAVATKKPKRWAELISFARRTAGTLVVPLASGDEPPPCTGEASTEADDAAVVEQAGADLLGEAPAVAAWVQQQAEAAAGPVTLGTYLYSDGEANVRITAAADCIADRLSSLGKDRVSFAWLASCATPLLIPAAAEQSQRDNLISGSTWWQRWSGTPQQCPAVGDDFRIYNGLEVMQGPNYALAQSMRQWRAMLLHEAGYVISTPVTPMCRTESVCHNRTMAALLDGVAYTKPLEAFEPETCRQAMLAILAQSLEDPVPALPSPFHLFALRSFHSGLWRCGFKMASLGTPTWLLGRLFPKQTATEAPTEEEVSGSHGDRSGMGLCGAA